MAHRGRSVASAALLAVALALFVPVFAEAATNFSYGDWQYGPYAQLVFSNIPILLGALALLVLGAPIARGAR